LYFVAVALVVVASVADGVDGVVVVVVVRRTIIRNNDKKSPKLIEIPHWCPDDILNRF
jgi:hypothetical protein